MKKTFVLNRADEKKHSVVFRTDEPNVPFNNAYVSRTFAGKALEIKVTVEVEED
jgi:hypothetical protein